MYRTVKKFKNRYESIWVLIADQRHPACIPFNEIYEEEKLNNVNQNL
jgi:hypothetical protein